MDSVFMPPPACSSIQLSLCMRFHSGGSSTSSRTMRAQASSLPFTVLLLIILTVGEFSVYGSGRRIASQTTEFSWQTDHRRPPSSKSFSEMSPTPGPGDDEAYWRFEESKRKVPGGPNPLHN
ncbi:hypothetical protein H6P81_016926 [Aristolochia fimbriata]|uniref:Uncharacterized protein n=1 Tax=Aristolochia fimbriata TaxID=158543 RepID=A0AAV7E123_ARIFI|nr:hypothetical protein H6P81_016926 [Aristolochia fimbriata]